MKKACRLLHEETTGILPSRYHSCWQRSAWKTVARSKPDHGGIRQSLPVQKILMPAFSSAAPGRVRRSTQLRRTYPQLSSQAVHGYCSRSTRFGLLVKHNITLYVRCQYIMNRFFHCSVVDVPEAGRSDKQNSGGKGRMPYFGATTTVRCKPCRLEQSRSSKAIAIA